MINQSIIFWLSFFILICMVLVPALSIAEKKRWWPYKRQPDKDPNEENHRLMEETLRIAEDIHQNVQRLKEQLRLKEKLIPNDSLHPPERYIDDEIRQLLIQRLETFHPEAVLGKMYKATFVFCNDSNDPFPVNYFDPELFAEGMATKIEEVTPGVVDNEGKLEWIVWGEE